ncbi:MAG TPA: hypothetical protein VIO38_02865 [Rariglobus sp.]
MANGGLNKPNLFTWVGNLASAKAGADFHANLNDFKTLLDQDFSAGAWHLLLAPVPVISSTAVSAGSLHTLRDACRRWVRDNPQNGSFADGFLDHDTYDGVHPDVQDIQRFATWASSWRSLR